jgi:hypothetical protein
MQYVIKHLYTILFILMFLCGPLMTNILKEPLQTQFAFIFHYIWPILLDTVIVDYTII